MEENRAFAEEQRFDFPLLSDHDRAIGAAYEVLRPGDHRYSAFPRRYSYLIDPEGIIRRSYNVTDVASHAGVVLGDLAELQR